MPTKELDLLHAARTEDLDEIMISQLSVLGEVERKVVDTLKFGGAHLLQGSRGIGKTMLLKQAELELDASFPKERVIGVYVNFKTSTLLEGVRADQKDAFQIWVGAKILQALYDKLVLLSLITNDSNNDAFQRIFGIRSISGIRQDLQEKIHLLQALSQKCNTASILNDIGDDFIRKANDISYINNIIKEIIEEYRLKKLIFLFDEAAHTFIPSQQEIFFEIFKLLHGGKVAVKAAVYPSITSYGRNFEIGHDAILITLGEFEPGGTGRANLRTMFRDLLDKRLPKQSKIRKDIFAKGELLDNCIDLSSGNPRAFLHLFNRVWDKGWSDRALILSTQEFVNDELLPYHNGLTKRLPKYSHHVRLGINLLQDYIIPEIKRKNNRDKKVEYQSAFFTIQQGISSNLKLALDLLCYSGVLSKQGVVKIASRNTGQRYMIHLAVLYTEKAFITNSVSDVMRRLSLTDYREFSSTDTIFASYLETLKSSTEKCSKCSKDINSDAKFCPNCGEKVAEKSIIGELLEDSIRKLSISYKIANRIEPSFQTVGDVIQSSRNEIMKINYIKEVRSRMIKNAADEYISG